MFIESVSDPGFEGKTTYLLLPNVRGIDAGDAQFERYARDIQRVLAAVGFTRASSIRDAALAIFVTYGNDRQHEQEYPLSLPVWGHSGLSSSTSGLLGVERNSGGSSYVATQGRRESTTHVSTRTLYLHYFILEGVDLDEYRRSGWVSSAWRTTVAGITESDDFHKILPVLIAASGPYVGNNTSRRVKVRLSQDDRTILELLRQAETE